MGDGIQRWDVRFMPPSGKPMLKADSGAWVRFSDVQARLEAADRLTEAVEVSFRAWGSWFGSPGGPSESVMEASDRAADALVAYREESK